MPGVLFLVHARPPDENSGAPLVADGYARSLIERGWTGAVVHASPSFPSWADNPLAGPKDPDADGVVRIAVPASPWQGQNWAVEASSASGYDDETAGPFSELLDELAPDVMHVVDNVHLPLKWPELARAVGIPVVRSVSCAEDLCGLIAPVSPLSESEGFCRAPITPQRCASCIAASGNVRYAWPRRPRRQDGTEDEGHELAAAMLANRQARLVRKLERKRQRAEHQFSTVFDRVVFASPGFRDYFTATIPLDPTKVRVIEMGLDLSGWTTPKAPLAGDGEPLTFCLAATIDPNKGHTEVARAFLSPALLGRDDYRLVLMGGGDIGPLSELIERNPAVTVVGTFSPAQFPQLLSTAHVGLTTSHFETFHRVTREYLLAGLPVVANAVFGVTDIVDHEVNGLLYHDADAGQLALGVTRLLDDRDLYRRLATGARATPVRALADEVDELESLYSELIPGRP